MPQTRFGDFGKTPDDACVNYKRCGNTVPGGGMMCSECLDNARKQDAGT